MQTFTRVQIAPNECTLLAALCAAKARRVPPMTNAPPASAENSERTTPEPFGALAEGRELYSCVRCRRLIDRSSERSGHECRWHRGPVRYTSSVCTLLHSSTLLFSTVHSFVFEVGFVLV